jgi:RNA recognition motif-containing protein
MPSELPLDSDALDASATLIIRNLPLSLRQDRLLQLINMGDEGLQAVNYQYDHSGHFRGVAIAKFNRVESAMKACERLNGTDVGGRTIQTEVGRGVGLRGEWAMPGSAIDELSDALLDPDLTATYQQLQAFRDNSMMKEISFVETLTMTQRSQIHMIAECLGLNHTTLGSADSRFVFVSKPSNEFSSVLHPSRQTRSVSIQEHTTIPRVPDGTKGFSIGRGRRASTPHPILKNGPSPLQFSSRSVSVPIFPHRMPPQEQK